MHASLPAAPGAVARDPRQQTLGVRGGGLQPARERDGKNGERSRLKDAWRPTVRPQKEWQRPSGAPAPRHGSELAESDSNPKPHALKARENAATWSGALGRSQAVRQRILVPPCGGSNPPAPANDFNSLSFHTHAVRRQPRRSGRVPAHRPRRPDPRHLGPLVHARRQRRSQPSRLRCERRGNGDKEFPVPI